ncbi:hypothetical protein [Myroides sp. LJL119]
MQEKKTLLILSDIFGTTNATWLNYYIKELQTVFHIELYDSLKLGGIFQENLTQEDIHHQFVTSSLQVAVTQLLNQVKNPIDLIVGFSIGGTIAWKAALQGLEIQKLCLVSSTRIRKEQKKPTCQVIDCFYADLDQNKPDKNWFDKMQPDSVTFFKKQGHLFYKDPYYIKIICKFIIQNYG